MKLKELYDSCVVVTDNGVTTMFSYETAIVQIKNNVTYLDEKYWNFSRTTSKHRNLFLNESTSETIKKIQSNEYVLTNLN